jgi:hypothetical protein
MQLRLLGAAGAALLMAAGPAFADDIRVLVNGDPVRFPYAQPTRIAGRVMIPLRGVLERLGADRVQWRPQRQEVWVSGAGADMRLRIGDRVAVVDGQPVTMDVPPLIVQNTTMVPLRFVSENLGARVDWLPATDTVYIATPSERVAGAREVFEDEVPAPERQERLRSPYLRAVFPPHGVLVNDPRPEIFARFRPNADIDYGTVRLHVNGREVTRDSQITREGVRFIPTDDLRRGRNDVRLSFRDTRGVLTTQEWFFFAP